MKIVKDDLKEVIVSVMLPESKAYAQELNNVVKNKTANEDDIDAKKDIEAFISELEKILTLIKEDKISNEHAKAVYEKIILMLNEHKE